MDLDWRGWAKITIIIVYESAFYHLRLLLLLLGLTVCLFVFGGFKVVFQGCGLIAGWVVGALGSEEEIG